MRKLGRTMAPLAAASMALVMSAGVAQADDGQTYQATLGELNHSGASGMLTVSLNGDQATIEENWSGLASTFNGGPFPHVQHIHIGANGSCPTPAADANGDGVVSTPEAAPNYGPIGTTLSVKGDTSPNAATNINIAPGGSSTNYHRTFTVSQDTVDALQSGDGVVVVHGLDPTTLSKKAQKEKSPLVPELPLAATAPALCGELSSMPTGGVATGDGSTSGIEDSGLFAAGGGLLAAGAAAYGLRRRYAGQAR